MTTNKPEVVAWLHSVRQDSDVITDKVRHVWGTPRGSMGEYTEPLIRLSDYEALQAECEELRKDAARYRWLRDIGRNERAVLIVELLEERDALQAEVEALREALEECAASLAWNCFGECRAIHAGPIMPAAKALETARKALSAHNKQEGE